RIRALLLKHGADYDVLAATGFGDEETVRRLFTSNSNLMHARDHQGDTPLHWAVRANQSAMTDFWLKAGASTAATNAAAQTPAHIAAILGLREQLTRLLAAQSPLDVRDTKGATPLEAAVQAKQTETARLLLQTGSAAARPAGIGVAIPIHEAAAAGN